MTSAWDVDMRLDVRIPMRDGGYLSSTVYRPHDAPPAPSIFTITPYTAQSCHAEGVYFASRGMPFVAVDVRGRGDSPGIFRPNSEAMDAVDATEWLSKQPWCDGQVAMWGLSYMGYAQWRAAAERPAALRTIVPVASPYRGVDSPARNNLFSMFVIRWLTGLAGRGSHPRILEDVSFWRHRFRRWYEAGLPLHELDGFMGCPSTLFQEWIRHPERGEYWDAANPTAAQYAGISIPILTITGIHDADQPGAIAHYREHLRNGSGNARSRHWLVIGPWDHAGTRVPRAQCAGLAFGPAALLDLRKLHLDWYAWVMAKAPRPDLLSHPVTYYALGAEEWRHCRSLDSVTARHAPLYLGEGQLLPEPVGSGHATYVYDPRDVSLAELEADVDPESMTDPRLFEATRHRSLVYESRPLEQDLDVAGFFRLSLWLAIDRPDTTYRATISEVSPEGRAVDLTADFLRARYRESFRKAVLVDTADPLRYDFENFPFTARRLRKGSRLRLVVGPLDSIYWQRTYNSGKAPWEESMRDAQPVEVELHHGGSHPSCLFVPLASQVES